MLEISRGEAISLARELKEADSDEAEELRDSEPQEGSERHLTVHGGYTLTCPVLQTGDGTLRGIPGVCI